MTDKNPEPSLAARQWCVRNAAALVLLKVAALLQRPRVLLIRAGAALDALDYRIGNATWWCRHKADRLRAGEGDDGIPF